MDIQGYLAKKERRFSRAARRLRDAAVFQQNFVPPAPLLRRELEPVIDALVRYEKTGVGNHVLIIGSRGCGKTVSMLYLRQLFSERGLQVLYGNCRTHNTSYKLLAKLLDARARGVSFTELVDRFAERYPRQTVVVLDEVDLLSEKDTNKDLLYYLSRAQGNYMAVMLSNRPRWAEVLDESTRSSLQPEMVYFRPYTSGELEKILRERARLGVNGLPSAAIKKIVALTAKYTNSDVRVALKTLYYWATEPEDAVDEHFQRARRDIVSEVVANLNDKTLLILKAGAGGEHPVKTVYQRYRELCARHGEEPFSYVHFYSVLSYLQSLGLILLSSTKIRRAYTKLLELTFAPEILDRIWEYRFA